MNQNNLIHLENYKEKYKYRVYYANRCNYCFSVRNLKKCGDCKAVNYCCKKHQKEDWPFHKPTCIAFKKCKAKITFPENCNEHTFFQYRINLLVEMVKQRSSKLLTEYEKQICLQPSVCMVCFKKPSKKYRCVYCQCVDYCSEEHKKSDERSHKMYCYQWWWCRMINSSSYSNGYRIHGVDFSQGKIRIPKSQKWPETTQSLFEMIKKGTMWIRNDDDEENIKEMKMHDKVRMYLLVDPYIPAAIIISALEKAKFVRNRHLITKSREEKNYYKDKQRKSTKYGTNQFLEENSTMVVHFAIADGSELKFDWNKIARLLTDWLINIERVHIVLTDPYLEKCNIPYLEDLENVEVTIHKKAYEEVNDLPKPDVIVLLECDRYFGQDDLQVLNEKKHKVPFFKYSNIPVILCDGRIEAFAVTTNFLLKFLDIECIVPSYFNNFTGKQTRRIWTKFKNVYWANAMVIVFKKK